jgi:Na+-transporting NADH:ubiquinone oxidoreductase subunit D
VMAISVMAVMGIGNLVISILGKMIPPRIRIIVQLVVIASLVILVDMVLKAFAYEVSKQLSVFVGLIITNCIIMGRFEAFAMSNRPWPSFLDGIGNAFGYAWILVVVGFFRELLGAGTLWGYQIVPDAFYQAGYVDNGLMLLPPMALIVVSVIIWIQRSRNKELIEH